MENAQILGTETYGRPTLLPEMSPTANASIALWITKSDEARGGNVLRAYPSLRARKWVAIVRPLRYRKVQAIPLTAGSTGLRRGGRVSKVPGVVER